MKVIEMSKTNIDIIIIGSNLSRCLEANLPRYLSGRSAVMPTEVSVHRQSIRRSYVQIKTAANSAKSFTAVIMFSSSD